MNQVNNLVRNSKYFYSICPRRNSDCINLKIFRLERLFLFMRFYSSISYSPISKMAIYMFTDEIGKMFQNCFSLISSMKVYILKMSLIFSFFAKYSGLPFSSMKIIPGHFPVIENFFPVIKKIVSNK